METQNLVRKTMLAGIGLYSLTRERAQELVGDLVKRGELSNDQSAKFVKSILEKADEEVTNLKKLVDKRVNETLGKMRPSYDDDIKKLNRKIDKLTKQVENLAK